MKARMKNYVSMNHTAKREGRTGRALRFLSVLLAVLLLTTSVWGAETSTEAVLAGANGRDITLDFGEEAENIHIHVNDGNAETVPSEDVILEETEAETEPALRQLVYEDSEIRVVATILVASAIPEDAELVVEEIVDEEQIKSDLEKAQNALEEGKSLIRAKVYDIHFRTEDQDDIEPESGTVDIQMTFLKSILGDSDVDSQENVENALGTQNVLPNSQLTEDSVSVFHIEDGKASTVEAEDQEVSANKDGVDEVGFSTDSFSHYVVGYSGYVYDYPGVIGTDTFDTILGSAIDYGIVADECRFGGDIESNVATLKISGLDIGIDYANSDGTELDIIGYIDGSLKFGHVTQKGNNAIIYMQQSDLSKITNNNAGEKAEYVFLSYSELEEMYTDVRNDVINGASVLDDVPLASVPCTTLQDNTPYGNNFYLLDVTGSDPNGTFYFDYDEFVRYGALTNRQLRVNKYPGQTIVFVSKSTAPQVLYSYNLCNDGSGNYNQISTSGELSDAGATGMIYYFPNTTKVNFNSSMAGTVIAPNADIYIDQTSAGWIVGKSISNGSEWHFVFQTLKRIVKAGSATVEGRKSVNGARPADGQVFTFNLQQYTDNTFAVPEGDAVTTQNTAEKFSFTLGEYRNVGTYYYKITESGSSGFEYNPTVYYVKAVVTSNTVKKGNTTTITYIPNVTIYSDAEMLTEYRGYLQYDNTPVNEVTDLSVEKVWVDNNSGHSDDSVVVNVYRVLTSSASVTSNESSMTGSADRAQDGPEAYLEAEETVRTGAGEGYTVTVVSNNPWYSDENRIEFGMKLSEGTVFDLKVQLRSDSHEAEKISVTVNNYSWPNMKFTDGSFLNNSTLELTLNGDVYEGTIRNLVMTASNQEILIIRPWTPPTASELKDSIIENVSEAGSGDDEGTSSSTSSSGGSSGSAGSSGGSTGGSGSSSASSGNTGSGSSSGQSAASSSGQSSAEDNSDGLIEEGTVASSNNASDNASRSSGTLYDAADDSVVVDTSAAADGAGTDDGPEIYTSLVLNEENSWKAELENLPKKVSISGVEYDCTYYVTEADIPEGYTVAYTDTEGNTVDLSNPVAGGTITVTNTLQKGKLIIYKTTTGHVTPDNTVFTITGPNGYTATVRYDEFNHKDAEIPYHEIGNLDEGTYTVEENTSSDSGGAMGFTPEGRASYNLTVEYTDMEGTSVGQTREDGGTYGSMELPKGGTAEMKITNTYTTSYTMPATGGPGTAAVRFAGLLLLALAGAGWVLRRRRLA